MYRNLKLLIVKHLLGRYKDQTIYKLQETKLQWQDDERKGVGFGLEIEMELCSGTQCRKLCGRRPKAIIHSDCGENLTL